jgi:hypothetical protein
MTNVKYEIRSLLTFGLWISFDIWILEFDIDG